MSSLQDWIDNTLYPELFNHIDRAFPEHNFKRYAEGWRSNTYISGALHPNRIDKTKIKAKAPHCIFEEGGTFIDVIGYVSNRDNTDRITAIKTLAVIAGLSVPNSKDYDSEDYKKRRDRLTLLEDCNQYFIWCLENSPGAKEVTSYLNLRGYSQDEIKAMELGYIPSQEQLFKYLSGKNYSKDLIEETISIKSDTRIGSSHKLAIAYRSGGTIKGFKFRATGEAHPKYLNTSGLDRTGGFYNLLPVKGDKDIIIVEGEIDSLYATIKGVDNVVALGGSSINSSQVKDAKSKGAKSFTICLDTEPGKELETAKHINSIAEVILSEGVNRVYIVILPAIDQSKTDPDRLIREHGVEAFRKALETRLTWGAYIGERLLDEFESKAIESGEIDYKERDLLREKAIKIRSELSAQNRIDFNRHLVEPLRDHGFNEELLSTLEEDYRTSLEEAAQNQRLDKLLRDTQQISDKSKALESLKNGLKEIDHRTGKGLLPVFRSYSILLEEIATIQPALKTGYRSLDKFAGFNPSAITLIAGRPSHGKTTLMFNFLLEVSNSCPDQTFYFFTYEEPIKNLSVKLLNRLVNTDLHPHFDRDEHTNYEFLKGYIRDQRTDIAEVEVGKEQLRQFIDNDRIHLVDRNYSVEELSSLLLYLNKREKIGGVFIDYIQRMRTERKTSDKRTEIAHISDQVLQIAKETGLPIILGAQLNRDTTKTGDKKPSLENLKEAGNLEEDANTVLSVYNESREKSESETGEKYSSMREVSLEIKALKNREGEVNRHTTLTFDKWTGVIKEKTGRM